MKRCKISERKEQSYSTLTHTALNLTQDWSNPSLTQLESDPTIQTAKFDPLSAQPKHDPWRDPIQTQLVIQSTSRHDPKPIWKNKISTQ